MVSPLQVWWYDVEDVTASARAEVLSRSGEFLSEAEEQRACSFRDDADRLRYVLGSLLLRCAIAECTGTTFSVESLERSCPDCGKPHGPPRDGAGRVHLSASHSGRLVLVGASPVGPIGVDVQASLVEVDEDLALLVSNVDETPTLDADSFTRRWCRKEAVLKFLGVGLKVDMRNVSVDDAGGWGAATLFATGARTAPTQACFRDLAPPVPGYHAAIATSCPPLDPKVSDGAALLRSHLPTDMLIAAAGT